MARISSHEAVCAERWIALERTLTRIEKSLDRIDRRLWVVVYGAAASMAAAVGGHMIQRIGG